MDAKTVSKKKVKGNGELTRVKETQVTLPELDMRQATFFIKGDTPLIVNQFSQKAIDQILGVQTGKATKGREKKNPKQQYLDSLYLFNNKKDTGFPAVGFKAAMTRAGKQLGMNMTDTRGKFHVLAEEGDLVKVYGRHEMRKDMVRVANGNADVRFRGVYNEWKAKVSIVYNATTITEAQLANLLRMAGFSCGIGEWRPEKSNSGSYGLFHLTEKF